MLQHTMLIQAQTYHPDSTFESNNEASGDFKIEQLIEQCSVLTRTLPETQTKKRIQFNSTSLRIIEL